MKAKLKEIKIEEAKKIISDVDMIIQIEKKKEPIFILLETKMCHEKIDPLLDLEISLNKCKRLGVLK